MNSALPFLFHQKYLSLFLSAFLRRPRDSRALIAIYEASFPFRTVILFPSLFFLLISIGISFPPLPLAMPLVSPSRRHAPSPPLRKTPYFRFRVDVISPFFFCFPLRDQPRGRPVFFPIPEPGGGCLLMNSGPIPPPEGIDGSRPPYTQ